MQNPQAKKDQAREHVNPIPSGTRGIQTLRGLSDCSIPDDANNIKHLLEKALEVLKPEKIDDLAQVVGAGLAAIMMTDVYCGQHKTQRPAVRFEDDEALNALHTNLANQKQRFDALQQEMITLSRDIQVNLKQRWQTAVSRFGLAPDKYSYELNEEDGTIYLVGLNCQECRGKQRIRQATQHLADKLLEYEQEAVNDEPGKGGSKPEDAGDGRETGPTQ